MSSPVALPRRNGRLVVLAVAAALVVLAFAIYGGYLKPRTWTLNDMLRADPELSAYPYDTRIVNFLNGVVTLTRPYTDYSGPEVFLVQVDPTLKGLSPDDPKMRQAKEALRQHEQRAVALLLEEPDIESVNWWLDEAWYDRRGLPIPPRGP